MKVFKSIRIFYILITLCVGKNLFAQNYYQSMGSSGASMVAPTEAALLNPALLGYMQKNHIHLFYDQSELKPASHMVKQTDKAWGVNIVDTSTSALFPGAFTFAKFESETEGYEARMYKLSFARREYAKASFGLALARYEISAPNLSEDEHDINLGITYSPTEMLGFSFVVDNVGQSNKDFLKTYYTLAAHYIYEPFMKLNLDLGKQDRHQGENALDIKTGISIPLGRTDFNMGYANLSSEDIEYFTLGLVWRGPRLGLSYAYRDVLGSMDGTGHFIDMGLFF